MQSCDKCALYDANWVVFMLTDSRDYNLFVGGEHVYTVKYSRYAKSDWRLALGDFMEYYAQKNMVLVLSRDELEGAEKACVGHAYNETLRPRRKASVWAG